MRAIFKREMRAYFASPVGYVVVAALLALYGFFYYQVMAIGSQLVHHAGVQHHVYVQHDDYADHHDAQHER